MLAQHNRVPGRSLETVSPEITNTGKIPSATAESEGGFILPGNEEIRSFIDQLTATTNVSKYVQLPMIAVMGDTSSGKSSLLSSISGVELPSSSELTTRCPIMLQMTRAETRKAVVNVQWKTAPERSDGVVFETETVTDDNWTSLSDIISKAQEHIIRVTGKEVARDIVLVEVQGPSCEDLTLIDLPGIVRTSGVNESETMKEQIQVLINDYLRNNRCVILAVVPANVDFHNSQILADARNVDPETKRTIPVITKPDLVDRGAEGEVRELLLGQKTHSFQLGFHMVKGRGQAEINDRVTIEEGTAKEESFFSSIHPWRDVRDRTLFGTSCLRKKLGEIQVDLIRETLPQIIGEIKEMHELATEELVSIGDIPTSIEEKRVFFRELSSEIHASIVSMLTGSTGREAKRRKLGDETFASKLHMKCSEFASALQSSELSDISQVKENSFVIVTLKTGETIRGKVAGESNNGDLFIDCEGRADTANKELATFHGWDKSGTTKTPSGKQWKSIFGDICIADHDGYYELKPIPKDRVRRDPAWIVKWIKNNRTEDLPVFVNQDLFRVLLGAFIDDEWLEPCQHLVKETQEMLVDATVKSLERIAKLSEFPKLHNYLRRRMEECINELAKRAKDQTDHFIEKERTPYTQNHYLHENLAKRRLDPIFRGLETALDLNSRDSTETISKRSIQSILRAVRDQNQRKSVEDHMAEDMQDMLDAYSKVALKRFIDVIPMECWAMFRTYPAATIDVLKTISDDDGELNRYLVVRRNALKRQQELTLQVQELKAGMNVLETLC